MGWKKRKAKAMEVPTHSEKLEIVNQTIFWLLFLSCI